MTSSPSPSPSTPSPSPSPKDPRRKFALNKSAKVFQAVIDDIEKREGRKVSTDEAVMVLCAHYEMIGPDHIEAESSRRLKELRRFLDDANHDGLGEIVELFRENIMDVIRGKMTERQLREVLIG